VGQIDGFELHEASVESQRCDFAWGLGSDQRKMRIEMTNKKTMMVDDD
jgi:hypothetical protein